VELPESGIRLFLANERDWEEPARSLGWLKGWGFARGFVSFAGMDAAVFLERAEQLFSIFPVRHLGLQGDAHAIAELAACPFVERLVGLSIRESSMGDGHVELLASSPYIRNLRWLDLRCNRIGLSGFEALAASPYLDSLIHVSLAENAAPDPVRVAGYDWTGAKVYVSDLPETGQQLEAKYGYKRWLHGAELIYDYPPPFEAFDGDEPAG